MALAAAAAAAALHLIILFLVSNKNIVCITFSVLLFTSQRPSGTCASCWVCVWYTVQHTFTTNTHIHLLHKTFSMQRMKQQIVEEIGRMWWCGVTSPHCVVCAMHVKCKVLEVPRRFDGDKLVAFCAAHVWGERHKHNLTWCKNTISSSTLLESS